MKAYRSVSKQLPTEGINVLVSDSNDDKYVAYYDGDDWFESHTEQHIPNVIWWMYIPITPNE